MIIPQDGAHNLLRPEAIESIYYMWYFTGDPKYNNLAYKSGPNNYYNFNVKANSKRYGSNLMYMRKYFLGPILLGSLLYRQWAEEMFHAFVK